MIGRDVTVTIGDEVLDFNLSAEIIEPVEFKPEMTKVFAFNAESDITFPCSAEFTGIVTYDDGRKLKLEGMKNFNVNNYFTYNFECGKIMFRRFMKTKGKQPRMVKVWCEL